jgi:ELWxxDGT repeat protein
MNTLCSDRDSSLDLSIRHYCVEQLESRRLLDSVPGPTSVQIGNTLYYAHDDNVHGVELWKSNLDGTNAMLVKDIYPGPYGSSPDWLFNYNGTLLFTAYGWSSGDELWRSDGTEAGTVQVKNIYSGASSSYPHDFTLFNGRVVFFASPSWPRDLLYSTDGTTGGTVALSSDPASFLVFKTNVLYFEQSPHGSDYVERLQSDGTAQGTKLSYGGLIVDRALRVFATDANDDIRVQRQGARTMLSGAGAPKRRFANGDFSSIVLYAQYGNDRVSVDDAVRVDESIYPGGGDDTVRAGSGNDEIYDQAGSDVLDGGRGNDSITDWGDDYVIIPNTLRGGPGNDTITSEWGLDCITGGSGDDSVLAGFYNDRIDGGDGNDILNGALNDDTLLGGAGNDTLIGSEDRDSLSGGAGNDSLDGSAGDDTLSGGTGADTLNGGVGVDFFNSDALDTILDAPSILLGSGGLLDVSGTLGDDDIHIVKSAGLFQAVINGQATDLSPLGVAQIRISGGAGNDTIQIDPALTMFVAVYGGDGDDAIHAGDGQSYLFGESGNDTILGGDGSDCIDGGLGSDSLDGGGGNNLLSYWRRTDRLIKTDGSDMTIRTSAGEVDTYNHFSFLVCGDADDTIVINSPLDTIHYIDAKEGNDSLVGGAGNDRFYGEEGDDTLIGGGGNDFLEGGPGNNTIIYGPALRPSNVTLTPVAQDVLEIDR